jgi:BASS family bile acid:Na+ symporter
MSLQNHFKEYTWAIILIAIGLSLAFPTPGLMIKPYLLYLLMGLMVMGTLQVHPADILQNFKSPKNIILSLGIIHLIAPFIVILCRSFFSDEIFLGLIIASVVPSGLAVVFLSHHFGGIASKALVITTISNVISPILVPLLVYVSAKTSIRVDYISMTYIMLKLVVIPLVLVWIINRTPLKKPLNENSTYISLALLFIITLGLIAPAQEIFFADLAFTAGLVLFIAIIILINFSLGYVLGNTKAEKITYGITSAYKNFSLAAVLALTLFDVGVAFPALMFALTNNALIAPMQWFLKQKT